MERRSCERMEREMEAGEIGSDNFNDVTMGKMLSGHANPSAEDENFGSARFESSLAKEKGKLSPQIISPENNATPSVSNCYVFKSRLQEYAQRAGLTIPVYETIKEGPSHEPFFRSTVIFNNARYDSLPGFFNRKAAEQSAAEVALVELSKSAEAKFGITAPVHETGLCKNLLQEYAQKMNYAVPWYECTKDGNQGKQASYSCTVEIGSTKYVGASAGSKKEAEIKAARTALLAIQSASSEERTGNSVYTVIPQKKRSSDIEISTKETAAALKPKKCRFKKHQRKKTHAASQKHCSDQGTMDGGLEVNTCSQDAMESKSGDASCAQQSTADEMTAELVRQGGAEVGVTDGVQQNVADGMIVQMVEPSTADMITGQKTGGVGSQEKPAYSSDVKTDSESVTGPSMTNSVSLQREDSELDPMETSGCFSSQAIAADGLNVKRDSQSVRETSVTKFLGLRREDSEVDPMGAKTSDGVGSQEIATDGSEVMTDSQIVTEPTVTNFVGLQKDDSGLDPIKEKNK